MIRNKIIKRTHVRNVCKNGYSIRKACLWGGYSVFGVLSWNIERDKHEDVYVSEQDTYWSYK
jgi:hypothetical protein